MKRSAAPTRFTLLFQALEALIVGLAVFVVNTNALTRFRQFPEVDNLSDGEGVYIAIALLALAGMVFVLRRHRLFGTYYDLWKSNWPLLLFLLYCTLTVFWSVYVAATQYKLVLLWFASLTGAYLAVRYGERGILNMLLWIGGAFTALSILVVTYFPFLGVMQNETFYGSWTGIFWHRNHTGNIFAFFNVLFLLRLWLDSDSGKAQKIFFAVLYLLTAAMVFGSRSATGIIVFLFLNFVTILIGLWLKFNHRMRPLHYYVIGGSLFVGFLIFVTNTSFFFGLLGRSSTMTGRIPLWQDLLQRVYMQEPIFGYGYGALWMLKSFRIAMQLHHNWPYQIYFADNGFLDILLNTGLVGLLLFLATYCLLGLRGLRGALRERSWIHFVSVLTFLYIFLGNLTYSFMLEVDQFVWMLLVVMLFLTTSPSSTSIPQPYNQPKNTKLNSDR